MYATLFSSYPKNGKIIFKYQVFGTPEELANYKALQGSFLRYTDDDETKPPLWFTPTCTGKRVELKVSSKGKIYPDNGELNALQSLAQHLQGPIGDALGAELAKQLLAEMRGAGKSQPATTTAPVTAEAEQAPEQPAEPADTF